MSLNCSTLALIIAWLLAVPLAGAVPMRGVLEFSYTGDVGFGNEVFVRGSHADFTLGGRLPHGVKLHWSAGNVWRARVAVESGVSGAYAYYRHSGTAAGYCTGTAVALTGNLSFSVPAPPAAPYEGKIVRYTSGWAEAILVYRNRSAGGGWAEVAMVPVGVGHVAGEVVYEARVAGGPGDEFEFVFRNAQNAYDNAPAPPQDAPQGAAPGRPAPYQSLAPPYNYRTRLPVFHVQAGQVFNYPPPAAPSAPRVETRTVQSTVGGIPARTIRIWLPRGYDNNIWKRYPVVYFHDGQNVFFPGSAFGTWDADRIARYETAQGRMREAILVAVDNADAYGGTRRSEYVPPGDSVSGLPGRSDAYARFLLDNVLPTLDHNYRTLNEPGKPPRPGDTILAGSSLGGIVTAAIGREHRTVFGRLGIFSPAFWAMPNYLANSFLPDPKLPLRIYMDIGSAESSGGQSSSAIYWNDALAVANNLLADGYAWNQDFLLWPECGGLHNEAAWSRRLPVFFEYVLGVWEDPQWLAAQLAPPAPVLRSLGTNATLDVRTMLGIPLVIESSTDLRMWSPWAAPAPPAASWDVVPFEGPLPSARASFWRTRIPLPVP